MTAALRAANLIGNDDPDETDVKNITRAYVTDQLLWYPFGSQAFTKHLSDALQTLQSILLEPQLHSPLPSTTEKDIADAIRDDLIRHEHFLRHAAIDALRGEPIPNFPDVECFKEGSVDFQPQITPITNQSAASLQEQNRALNTCITAIDKLHNNQPSIRNCLVVAGPPGAGKTHILLLANTYALSKNMPSLLAAITSERARRLGGIHIHMLFHIPVLKPHVQTIQHIVSSALMSLSKKPVQLAMLQRLKVLFIEEIGLLSAQLFAALDNILRYVRGSNQPMGGILVIATGDPYQLAPVDGTPFWASHHVITSFHIITMRHYVRACQDADLQQLIQILRNVNITNEEIENFIHIIAHRCLPHAVPSWDDVPSQALKIVGTKAACQEIIDGYIAQKQSDPTLQCKTFLATDEVETTQGVWGHANANVQFQLDKACLEHKKLVLFKGQILRLTYNNTVASNGIPRFSQGQLCIVMDLPNETHHLHLMLVPPGVRQIPTHPENMPYNHQWELFFLSPTRAPLVIVGKGHTKARRIQFRVTYYVCSTVHKALGETCPQIATQISSQQRKYRLWERDQLLVLISRVKHLDNIILVTHDRNDTIMGIRKLLQNTPQWLHHIKNILSALDSTTTSATIQHTHDPYPPTIRMQQLPDSSIGFVYMLVSHTHRNFAYVGETACIQRRLQQHNSSHGSNFTNNPQLRPWMCFVLVYRFPENGDHQANINARKNFEHQWHTLNAQDHLPNTRTIYTNGKIVFNRMRHRYPSLLWEDFGHIHL